MNELSSVACHSLVLVQLLFEMQDDLLTSFSGFDHPTMLAGLALLAFVAFMFTYQAVQLRRMSPGGGAESAAIGTSVVLYLASMASTSFIEEEHETWFFLGASIMAFSALRRPHAPFSQVLFLAATRLLRGWSRNGA